MNRNIKQMTQLGLGTLIFMCTACHSNAQEGGDMKDAGKAAPGAVEIDQHARPVEISINEQIQGAITDLATRINVEKSSIKVREARSVQWGSGAMGCPKPGMNYTQAIVPGIRLLLEADEAIYYYHGVTGSNLFYCPADRAQAPTFGKGQEVM